MIAISFQKALSLRILHHQIFHDRLLAVLQLPALIESMPAPPQGFGVPPSSGYHLLPAVATQRISSGFLRAFSPIRLWMTPADVPVLVELHLLPAATQLSPLPTQSIPQTQQFAAFLLFVLQLLTAIGNVLLS